MAIRLAVALVIRLAERRDFVRGKRLGMRVVCRKLSVLRIMLGMKMAIGMGTVIVVVVTRRLVTFVWATYEFSWFRF